MLTRFSARHRAVPSAVAGPGLTLTRPCPQEGQPQPPGILLRERDRLQEESCGRFSAKPTTRPSGPRLRTARVDSEPQAGQGVVAGGFRGAQRALPERRGLGRGEECFPHADTSGGYGRSAGGPVCTEPRPCSWAATRFRGTLAQRPGSCPRPPSCHPVGPAASRCQRRGDVAAAPGAPGVSRGGSRSGEVGAVEITAVTTACCAVLRGPACLSSLRAGPPRSPSGPRTAASVLGSRFCPAGPERCPPPECRCEANILRLNHTPDSDRVWFSGRGRDSTKRVLTAEYGATVHALKPFLLRTISPSWDY